MKSITLSNSHQTLIKDPIIGDFIKKSTDIIMAGINQEILAATKPKIYKYKQKKITVGKKKKMKYDSPGSIVLKHLDLDKVPNKERFVKRITRSTMFDIKRSTLIGNHVNLKLTKSLTTDKKLLAKTFHLTPLVKIDKNYLLKFLERFNSDEQETNNSSPKTNSKLKLYLKQVKCIDETNPERIGSDEIAMGAVFMDADGNETKLNEFHVGDNFDDGDTKNYNPSKLLKTYNISTGSYPQFYTAWITLAEKDNGGLSDFISELFNAVKAQTQKILETLGAAAGAYIGGKIGGSIGTTIAGPLGTAIGLIAGAILGAVIAELVNAFKDDIFEPQIATIGIPSATSLFENGSTTSPWKYLKFEGHKGEYQVKYKWKLVQS